MTLKQIITSQLIPFIVVVGFLISIAVYIDDRNDYIQKEAVSKEESGYEVYLNGLPVDLDHIDIRQYNININDQAKTILLSSK